jgi:hypothetical protein
MSNNICTNVLLSQASGSYLTFYTVAMFVDVFYKQEFTHKLHASSGFTFTLPIDAKQEAKYRLQVPCYSNYFKNLKNITGILNGELRWLFAGISSLNH